MRWRSPTERSATARPDRAAGRRPRETAAILCGELRERPSRRQRQRDVLGDGQRLEQREMLEHHADAEAARRGRTGES